MEWYKNIAEFTELSEDIAEFANEADFQGALHLTTCTSLKNN